MRIAFFTPEYITESNFHGGLANYINRISLCLRNRGHDVEIFTSSSVNESTTHGGIVVHRVRHDILAKRILNGIFRGRLNTTIDIIFRSYYIKKRFEIEHRRKPFDLVQAASFWATGILFASSHRLPVVTRVSSFEPLYRSECGFHCSLDNALAEWLEIVQMRNSSAVYSPSLFLSRIIKQFEPINVDVIYPPFQPPEWTEEDKSVYQHSLQGIDYLLFFGTICRLKGIDLIWRNLHKILCVSPNIHFVFVGKGSLPTINEELLSFKSRIHHFEPIPHPQLFPIIKNARAVVLPSIADNLPNACLESMYLAKTVVGTRGASFDEIIEDGFSGYLFNYHDDDEFCSLIFKICKASNVELSRIGSNAQSSILSKFNVDVRIDELESYFKKICG